jgi:negative regulator of flagellin synthesis FlgM
MKIDNSFKSVGGLPSGDDRPAKAQPKSEGAAPEQGVSVDISARSAQMQAMEARLGGTQVVDTARVSEIKQAIADGQFKVNPEVVADRLLATVKELIAAYRA